MLHQVGFLLTLNYDARNHELKKIFIPLHITPALIRDYDILSHNMEYFIKNIVAYVRNVKNPKTTK